jgi:hypothetical protein
MYFFKSNNAPLDRQLWLSVKIAKCRGIMYLDQISLRRAFHHAGMWFTEVVSSLFLIVFVFTSSKFVQILYLVVVDSWAGMFLEDLFVITPPKADLLPRFGYLPLFVLSNIFHPP